MENIIIILVVAIIIGFAGHYIHREKKRGVKCIGCPNGCCCNGKCNKDEICDRNMNQHSWDADSIEVDTVS